MAITLRQFFSRIIVACVLSVLSVIGLNSCGKPDPVRIGSHPWLGFEFLHLGHRLGQLPDHIQLNEYPSANEILKGLSKNEVDVATLSLDEVLIARARGIPMTVVMIFDISAGADMLLAPHNVKHLTDIKGLRIGYETSAHGQLILSKLLEAAGLTREDITAVAVPPYLQYEAWRQGKIDLVITHEPFAYRFFAEGFNSIFDSRQLPNMSYDVLAVRTDKLAKLSSSLDELTAMHFKMVKSFQSNPSDMMYEMTNTTNNRIPVDVMKRGLRGIALPSLERNYTILSDQETLKTIVKGLVPYTELTPEQLPDNIQKLFSTDYLPKYVPNGTY